MAYNDGDELNPLFHGLPKSGGVAPMPSMQGTSPLNDEQFDSALQMKPGQPDLNTNELFQGIPGGYDERLPDPAPVLSMPEDVIETQVPEVDKLKALVNKSKGMPAASSAASKTPDSADTSEKDKLEVKTPDIQSLLSGQGISKMLQGLSTMGGGKIDDNSDFYNQYRSYLSNQPNKDLDAAIKTHAFNKTQAEEDPNSPQSVNFRKIAAATMPDIVKHYGDSWKMISAADSQDILNFGKMRETIDARKDQMKLAMMAKNQMANEKNIEKLGDAVNPDRAKSGNMGKYQMGINRSDAALAIFNQYPDFNIPKNQTTELATAVAGLLSGGGSPKSQHLIDSLVPSSYRGSANDIASWITNTPRGREQQEFMKNLKDTTLRERSVQEDYLKSAQVDAVKNLSRAHKMDPQIAQDILAQKGIHTEDIDAKGNYVRKSSGGTTSAQDPQITQYAQSHNLNYDQAQAILLKRGYGK